MYGLNKSLQFYMSFQIAGEEGASQMGLSSRVTKGHPVIIFTP